MDFYTAGLAILVLVACLDLLVGVANDAVNFLNSAVGSRAASLRTLLWIASVGVLLGSLLSSGMMEVARSGIFVPSQFTFHGVMVVFLAVMVTDIILLDLFNTLGMPTSTTVSVVFELLGASAVVAVVTATDRGLPLSAVGDFINGAGALRIITGILLSVAIAFTAGLIAQWAFRLTFTFDLARTSPWLKRIWSGLALSAIGYFLVMKGLKHADVIPAAASQFSAAHPVITFVLSVAAATTLAIALERLVKLDPLRVTVLAGTFALATAFASNDLVNFIGVPLAGLAAHDAWAASGASPDSLRMDALAAPVAGQSGLLLLAGLMMVVTLHLSRKARSVTETEVNLGRQSAGKERFKPGVVSRALVGIWLWVDALLKPLIPTRLSALMEERFRLPDAAEEDRPAFDMLRASVNLTVASTLIVVATTMKLPLSTTFVTFMVAMGSSLADRSWGRDSAVYRVAGVGHVLMGWFATAALAALTAGLIATVLWFLEGVGLGLVSALAIVSLVLSTRWHRRRTARQGAANAESYVQPARLVRFLGRAAEGLRGAEGLLRSRGEARGAVEAARHEAELVEALEAAALRFAQSQAGGADRMSVVRLYRHEGDLITAVGDIIEGIEAHRANLHTPLDDMQARQALDALQDTAHRLRDVEAWLESPAGSEAVEAALAASRRRIQDDVHHQVGTLESGQAPSKASRLVLSILGESDRVLGALQEIVSIVGRLFPRVQPGGWGQPRPRPLGSAPLTAAAPPS